jgi:hypothetical protein
MSVVETDVASYMVPVIQHARVERARSSNSNSNKNKPQEQHF